LKRLNRLVRGLNRLIRGLTVAISAVLVLGAVSIWSEAADPSQVHSGKKTGGNASQGFLDYKKTMAMLNRMGISQGGIQYIKSAETDAKGWHAHLFRINQEGAQMPLIAYVSKNEVVIGILIRDGKLVVPKALINDLQPVIDMSRFKLSSEKRIVYNPNGKKTVYMFTDPDCPYCQKAEKALASYKGQYRVIVKHFPLEQIHPGAKEKAIQRQCLSISKNCDEQARSSAVKMVDEDIQEGNAMGVDSTPFFITQEGAIMRQIPDLK